MVMSLASCATSYQPIGMDASGGYFQTRKSENNYVVAFMGNSFTSPHYAYNMALLRGASLGTSLGYPWMAVTGEAPCSSDPSKPGYEIDITYFDKKPSPHEGAVFNTSAESQALREQYGLPPH